MNDGVERLRGHEKFDLPQTWYISRKTTSTQSPCYPVLLACNPKRNAIQPVFLRQRAFLPGKRRQSCQDGVSIFV